MDNVSQPPALKFIDYKIIIIVISAALFLVFGGKIFIPIVILVSFLIGLCFRIHKNYQTESLTTRQLRRVRIEWKQQLAANISNNGNRACTGAGGGGGDEQMDIKESRSRSKMDMRITGSSVIDETIHEMIDYILRDYIHSWYDLITDDDEFVHELRKNLQLALVTLSSRVKEVDWIPYLTTDFVDDAATHLRLYRQSKAKVNENPNNDLISTFFDFEAVLEKNLCRDMVCTDESHLNDYLQGLCEGILYLLIPQEVYMCPPLGSVLQDIIVNHVLSPLIGLLSEPDFVNQCIVWLCQEFVVSPEIFMTVIRSCDDMDEICAVEDFFDREIDILRSQFDLTITEDVGIMKQQLRCLGYVCKAIDQQRSQLKEGRSSNWSYDGELDEWQHYFSQPGVKIRNLSLEEVLKNSVALSYFLDYMTTVGGNNYLLMYLNADAWRVSGEVQLLEIEASTRSSSQGGKGLDSNNQAMLDCMRDAALNIYEQFLSDKATFRVKLPENVIKRFYIQVKTEKITSTLFDELQETLLETMQNTEKFFPSFIHNKLYIKCLMDLDLLKADTEDTVSSLHSLSSNSDEENEDDLEIVTTNSTTSRSSSTTTIDHVIDSTNFKSQFDLPEFQTCRECLKLRKRITATKNEDLLIWEKELWCKKYKLKAEVIETALTVEKGKTFGVYVVLATRLDEYDQTNEKKWHIYRRYSDFYDFHTWIKNKWMRINKVEFPSKQTFGKTDRAFLEKRMAALNRYLANILAMTSEPCFGESLQDSILHFLEPGSYTIRKRQFSEKIDTIVNPLKQSVKSVTDVVKTMPDTFLSTVDGLSKIFHSKPAETDYSEAIKVGAALDAEGDDNIPLRIIILLMDEVFDLKSKNQWLRRRLVLMIRQIIKAMMGDNLNRRIIEHVGFLTSPTRVAGYLRNLQEALWPGGSKISSTSLRDTETKQRTRMAAKAALLSTLSDEVKHLIGSETTRRGLLGVFELCQNRVLNKRFLIVIAEGIIKTLYPDKPFQQLTQRLHFRSNRVGKYRPFLVPTNMSTLKTTQMPLANLSPRGTRKRKP